jgi:hypothetical protein
MPGQVVYNFICMNYFNHGEKPLLRNEVTKGALPARP